MPEISDKFQSLSDDQTTTAAENHGKYCHCIAAVLLILTIVLVTLASTVFNFKSPTIRVERLTFDDVDLAEGSNTTLNVDVLVKNPNFASFRFGNMTTTLFYRGAVVGDLRGPPGTAEARRTARVNVTMDIMTDRVLTRPGLVEDMGSGLVNVSSYTRVGGRMKWFVFETNMRMKIKCDISFNVNSRVIKHYKCKRKIEF